MSTDRTANQYAAVPPNGDELVYRLFVAIDLPDNAKQQLTHICYGLPGTKWADDTQMHITLRFIGEVDGGVFQDIREALSSVTAKPFEVTIKGVGFFPPRKAPETLWAGIEKNESLNRLHNRIESVLVRAGLSSETRKFAPHVSLARLKGTPPARVAGFLSEHALLRVEPFEVTEFCLYSSFLSSEMALHEVEAVYPLTSV